MSEFFKDYTSLLKESEALKKAAQNPFYKSKYVQLKDVLSYSKELCVKHNFIFIQYPVLVEGQRCLQTSLRHISGESIESVAPLVEGNDPQKIGASITYMRRYNLTAILGLEEEDDDGNSNAKQTKTWPGKKTEAEKLVDELKECGKEVAWIDVLKPFNVKKISDLTKPQMEQIRKDFLS